MTSEMPISPRAIELENEGMADPRKGTLAAAYAILRGDWLRGDRDRELALHLMFLSWYMLIQPPHLTGFDETRVSSADLVAMFTEVHDHLAPANNDDAEALYAVGLMSHLAPWLLGDHASWEARSEEYRRTYRRLKPNGLDPSYFEGRGAYGRYFAGQAAVKDGY
jgi:hypothetical protein